MGLAVKRNLSWSLAEQSSASAVQIAKLIVNIQRDSERAVRVMQKGQVEVAAGVDAENSVGVAFETIVAEINIMVEQIQQVSAATHEMTHGTAQAVNAINSIGSIAERNATSSQEISSASEEQTATMESVSKSAEELSKLGDRLNHLVEKFKV